MGISRGITRGITRPITRKITDLGYSAQPFHPSSVFAARSAVGFAIDPADSTALFSDAAATTPLTINNNARAVRDVSGNNHLFTQATEANGPLWRMVGDYPVLTPDGSNDSMSSSSAIDFSGTNKMLILIGIRWRTPASLTPGVIAELTTNGASTGGGMYFIAGTDAGVTGFQSLSRGAGVAAGSAQTVKKTEAADSKIHLIKVTHDIPGDLSAMTVDGVAATDATGDKGSGNFANAVVYLFSRNNASLRLGADIHRMVMIDNTNLTSGDISKLSDWVNENSGAV